VLKPLVRIKGESSLGWAKSISMRGDLHQTLIWSEGLLKLRLRVNSGANHINQKGSTKEVNILHVVKAVKRVSNDKEQ